MNPPRCNGFFFSLSFIVQLFALLVFVPFVRGIMSHNMGFFFILIFYFLIYPWFFFFLYPEPYISFFYIYNYYTQGLVRHAIVASIAFSIEIPKTVNRDLFVLVFYTHYTHPSYGFFF